MDATDDSFPSLATDEESINRKKLMEYLKKHATKQNRPTYNPNLFDCNSQPNRKYNFDIEITKKVKQPVVHQEEASNSPTSSSDNVNQPTQALNTPPNDQLQSNTVTVNQKSNDNDQPIAVSPKIVRPSTTPRRRTIDLRRAVIEQNLNRDQFDNTKNSTFMDNTDAFMKQLPGAASTPHNGIKNVDVANKNVENPPIQTASIVKPTEFAININVNGNKDDNQPQQQQQQQPLQQQQSVTIPQSPSQGLVNVNYQSPTKLPQKQHQININVTPSRSKILSPIANNNAVASQMNPAAVSPNNHTITLNVVVEQDKATERSKHITPRKIQFSQNEANDRSNQLTDDEEKENDEIVEQSPSVVKERYANIIREKRAAEETFAKQSFKLPVRKRRRRDVQQPKSQAQEDYFNAGETIKNYQSHESTRTLYTKGNSLLITDDEEDDDDHISRKSQPIQRTKSDLTAETNLQKRVFRASSEGLPSISTKPLNKPLSEKEFAKLTQGFRSIAADSEGKLFEKNHTCRKSKPMSMSPHSGDNDNDNSDNDHIDNDDEMLSKNNDNSLELTHSIDCQFDKLDEASQNFVRISRMASAKKSHGSGTHVQPRLQLVNVMRTKKTLNIDDGNKNSNQFKKKKFQHDIEKVKSRPGPASKKRQQESQSSVQQSMDSADAEFFDCSEIFVPETQPDEIPAKSNAKPLKNTRKPAGAIEESATQQITISASQPKRKPAPIEKKQLLARQNPSQTSLSNESQDYDIEVSERQPDASKSKPKKYKPGPASAKSKTISHNKDESQNSDDDDDSDIDGSNDDTFEQTIENRPSSKKQLKKRSKYRHQTKTQSYESEQEKSEEDSYIEGTIQTKRISTPFSQNLSQGSISNESQNDSEMEVDETQPDDVPAPSQSKPSKYKPGPASKMRHQQQRKSKTSSYKEKASQNSNNDDSDTDLSEDEMFIETNVKQLKNQSKPTKYKPGPANKIQKQRKSKTSSYKEKASQNSNNDDSETDLSEDEMFIETNVKQLKNQSKPTKYKPGPANKIQKQRKSKTSSYKEKASQNSNNDDSETDLSEDEMFIKTNVKQLKNQSKPTKYKPGPASEIQKQRKSKTSSHKENETQNSDNYVSGSDNDVTIDDTFNESNVNRQPKRNAKSFNEDESQSLDHDSDTDDRTLTGSKVELHPTLEFTPISILSNRKSTLVETQKSINQDDSESVLEQHDANLSSSVSDFANHQSTSYESNNQNEFFSQMDLSPNEILTNNSQINQTQNTTIANNDIILQNQQKNLSKKMKKCFVKLRRLSHTSNKNNSMNDQSSLISNDISNGLFEKSFNQTIGFKRAQKRSQSAMIHDSTESNQVDFSASEESDFELELHQEKNNKNVKITNNRRKRRRKWDYSGFKMEDLISRYEPLKVRSPPKEGVRRSSRPRGKPHKPFAISYFYEKGEKPSNNKLPKENIKRNPLQMLKNIPAENSTRINSESLTRFTTFGHSEICLASNLKFKKENTFELAFYNLSNKSDGVMRFPVGGKKPLNRARVDMIFMPISGDLTFTIDGDEFKVSGIDLVKVNKGSKYLIVNQSKQIALVRFTCCQNEVATS